MKTNLFQAWCFCSFGATASAWTAPSILSSTKSPSSRRGFLDQAAKIVPLVVLPYPACAEDEAPALEAAAEAARPAEDAAPSRAGGDDNAFVARLKAQSDANRQKYQKEARASDKLSSRQFAGQYDRPSYVGVRAADGGGAVTMVLRSEIDEMLASGRVVKTYEPLVNKDGEVFNDYSKPIFEFAR